jgi:hypothetical protein
MEEIMIVQEHIWYELTGRKEDFLHIVRIVNLYYSTNTSRVKPTESYLFRERFARTSTDKVSIYIKKIGTYEFLIQAAIAADENLRGESDVWLHVDGIKQERDELVEKGVTEHPVFSIVCMTDLFETACVSCEAPPNLKTKLVGFAEELQT